MDNNDLILILATLQVSFDKAARISNELIEELNPRKPSIGIRDLLDGFKREEIIKNIGKMNGLGEAINILTQYLKL